jgi:hypothetical protein
MKKRGRSLKAVVNDALRAGLESLDRPARRSRRFRTAGFKLGTSRVGTLDNVEEVLSNVEGNDHR